MAKYITDQVIEQITVGIGGILQDYQGDIEAAYLNEELSLGLAISVKFTAEGDSIKIDTGFNMVKDRVKVKTTTVIDPNMQSIKLYIENRMKPGSFLEAIICNDLKEAVARADDFNIRNIPAYVEFFYNRAPINCWGSTEKYLNWIAGK